jgi:hypothetical protein
MCTVLLPLGDYPIAVNKYIISICWTGYKDMAVIVTWGVYGLPEFTVRGNSNLEVCKCFGETIHRKYATSNYYKYCIIIGFGALAFS